MRPTGLLCIAIFTAGLAALADVRQRDVTAAELIARWTAARGGPDRIASVRSISIYASTSSDGGVSGPLVTVIARPRRMRTEFFADGQTVLVGYDGRIAWMSIGKRARRLSPAETNSVAAPGDFDALISMLSVTGDHVSPPKPDTADGRAAYRLDATLAGGFTDVYFIDAGSWLLTKWRGIRLENGRPVVREALFRDYRSVDGIFLPFRVQEHAKGEPGIQSIALDSIKVNAPLPANAFSIPTAAPPTD